MSFFRVNPRSSLFGAINLALERGRGAAYASVELSELFSNDAPTNLVSIAGVQSIGQVGTVQVNIVNTMPFTAPRGDQIILNFTGTNTFAAPRGDQIILNFGPSVVRVPYVPYRLFLIDAAFF